MKVLLARRLSQNRFASAAATNKGSLEETRRKIKRTWCCASQKNNVKESINSEKALEKELDYLLPEHQYIIFQELTQITLVVAQDIGDLRATDVPFKHFFELVDDKPICSPLRRTPPRYTRIIKQEVLMMFRARIIKPENSHLGFTAVISRKKDEKHKFCVNYRALNRQMKANNNQYLRL